MHSFKAYYEKEQRFKMSDLSFHIKKIEKEEQIIIKVSRRNKMV